MRNSFGRAASIVGCRPALICLLAASGAFLGIAGSAAAQEIEPPPPAKKGTVRITFLPPPMEGTLSAGIYDKAGKLVRVLAREATEKDFVVGLNGLIATWDGKDDEGKIAPAGTYAVRGYSVGEIHVEGVAYHGNDWMSDDRSPHIRKVLSLALPKDGRLVLWAEGSNGQPRSIRAEQAGQFAGEIPAEPREPAPAAESGGAPETEAGAKENAPAAPAPVSSSSRAAVANGRVVLWKDGKSEPLDLPELTQPVDASLGLDGVWVIDRTPARVEVKEYSMAGVFQRRLAIEPSEPAPRRIFASRTSQLIFLIEEGEGVQRVRGLALETPPGGDAAEGAQPTSTWKTVLSKSIRWSDHFQEVAGNLGRVAPFIPRDKFVVHLIPNPLLRDALTTASVTVGFDAAGSFLKTLDGLPLRRITTAPGIKWVVIGQEGSGKQLTVFQGDGAVVEEFKAHKLANMMAFEAGEYEKEK